MSRLGQLDDDVRRQGDILSQHAVLRTTEGVRRVSSLHAAVYLRHGGRDEDGVADGEPGDVGTYLDYLAGHVRARDDAVLHRQRIRGRGDGDVAVVQRDAADLDEDLVLVGAGDRLWERLEPVEAIPGGPAEDSLGRHCGVVVVVVVI